MRIGMSKGLRISKIIFELLQEEIEDLYDNNNDYVSVGCFTNCRECGYTFKCLAENGKSFTFCIYEHRNSDEIIINGKEGYISMNGELPYQTDSKYVYLASFNYNQYYECAHELRKMICKFFSDNRKEVKE